MDENVSPPLGSIDVSQRMNPYDFDWLSNKGSNVSMPIAKLGKHDDTDSMFTHIVYVSAKLHIYMTLLSLCEHN